MQQFESFAQMQRDAAMRVMEMQRRAQAAMKTVPAPTEVPVPVGESGHFPLYEPAAIPDAPEHIRPRPDSAESVAPDLSGVSAIPNASDDSDEESEKALITAILLLLMREKADERLLFALLYILM